MAEGPLDQGPLDQGPVAQGPMAEGPVAEGPVAYSLSGPFKVYPCQQLTNLLNKMRLPLQIRVLNPTMLNMFGNMQKLQEMQDI